MFLVLSLGYLKGFPTVSQGIYKAFLKGYLRDFFDLVGISKDISGISLGYFGGIKEVSWGISGLKEGDHLRRKV